MRLFVTEFEVDGVKHIGPTLAAKNWEEAKIISEMAGLDLVCEISDVVLIDKGYHTLH